ncbi:MAG TPA: hypothetical protein VD927_15370 [Chryseosolibacter sp.]|nr:hypothetical protein [Chryseosolibacter sp.]
MEIKHFITLTLIAIILVGCSREDEYRNQTRISGIYKIVAIQTELAVDLNNDGVKSTDIYDEIKYYSLMRESEPRVFYDFETMQHYMVAHPLPFHENNAQLIALNIPDQVIDKFGDDSYYLSEYLHSFIAYSYELNDASDIVTLTANDASFVENGTLKELRIISSGHLRLTLTKKFFDFSDLDWVETEVTIDYMSV